MKQNYQLILDKTIEAECSENRRPTLLLHACCAPCSSYVLEYLSEYFDITLFFYNPNISPKEEHDFRYAELVRLVDEMGLSLRVKVIEGAYESERFYSLSEGLEELPEGGARCAKCYDLRLSETAKLAAEGKYDFFTTTLSISPYKNAEWLNSIGVRLGEEYGVRYLVSDFKKKNGYKRSCELSEKYRLYRQNYCGCEFSKR
ncbi:MAG: epoxyqueuosine reductase QueH [Ruminococcaceae bacterium]|nr:epoxyqueuosine reductase QueH [Oscillospiraceae bacterium]